MKRSCPNLRYYSGTYVERPRKTIQYIIQDNWSVAAIFNGVSRHTGVTRGARRCAAGIWGKVEKKQEKIEE
jgi:hypothetical protein